MKTIKLLLFVLSLLLLPGCRSSLQRSERELSQTGKSTDGFVADVPEEKQQIKAEPRSPIMQQVSLNQAQQSQSMAEAMNRKILRNAELTLEVSDPGTSQRKITSIAELFGGFVVLSESKQRLSGEGQQTLVVNMVVRIPAEQFDAALNEIRSEGISVIQEKTTGQDVTEEYIDLEARIRTQKALESQFLEIMKQANKVADALDVQRQIADVRTEIEKLEGRKRFLENRASLSTITVNLQTSTPIVVGTSSFGRNIRAAVADSVAVAGAIVLFLIRFVIVMIPVLVLIIVPGGLLARYVYRRTQRMQFASNSGSITDSD